MADLGPVISCLSASMTAMVAQEAAKLAEQMSTVIASFTDPLEALAATNVSQLVDDASSLASGNVAGNLASIGEAILVNKMKREVEGILAETIKNHPVVGDAIQRMTNLSEAVYGIVSLAVLLRKEAPYSAVKLIVDDMKEILDVKERNLNSMKKHIIQLNNTIMSTTKNPENTAKLMMKSVVEASSELKKSSTHWLTLELSLNGKPSKFVDKEYDSAVSDLETARGKLCKDTGKTNILDLGYAAAQGALGVDHLTEAQVQLSSYAMIPLTHIVECELGAIKRSTDRLNKFIARIPEVIPDYEATIISDRMVKFRSNLIKEIRIRVDTLVGDMDAAINENALNSLALHSMSWCSRLSAISQTAPKVANELKAGSADDERREQMSKEIAEMVAKIEDVDGEYVIDGMEDLAAMESQVTTLIAQARSVMTAMETGHVSSMDMKSFQITVNLVVNNSDAAISESLKTIGDLRSALNSFKTFPPEDQRIDKLIEILELVGLDRARDLLKGGLFKAFLDSDVTNASYIGKAIECLISAEKEAVDSAMLDAISDIRKKLQAQWLSNLAASFDILDSGKTAFISTIKRKLADGQENLAKAKRVIASLQDIYNKTKEAGSQLQSAANNLGSSLGEIATGLGGSLNETLSDLDVEGLQGGCMGQLRF